MQVDHFPALMRAKQHQAEERNENGNKTNPFENEIRFLSEEGPDAEHAESVGRHHQQWFSINSLSSGPAWILLDSKSPVKMAPMQKTNPAT